MAAGKTQLAKGLAQKLNLPLLDSDAELEKQEGMSISAIFETPSWCLYLVVKVCHETGKSGAIILSIFSSFQSGKVLDF